MGDSARARRSCTRYIRDPAYGAGGGVPLTPPTAGPVPKEPSPRVAPKVLLQVQQSTYHTRYIPMSRAVVCGAASLVRRYKSGRPSPVFRLTVAVSSRYEGERTERGWGNAPLYAAAALRHALRPLDHMDMRIVRTVRTLRCQDFRVRYIHTINDNRIGMFANNQQLRSRDFKVI